MFTTKLYFKKTKIGNFLKNIREHYLRDDIGCGSLVCEQCSLDGKPRLAANPNNANSLYSNHYLILDTNIDVLEEDDIKNVIILQTVLQEVAHRSLPTYKRLNSIIENPTRQFYIFANEHHKDTYIYRNEAESMNDHNDKSIRCSCKWYQKHLPDIKIVLLTDDVANRKLAQNEKIASVSVSEYVKQLPSHDKLEDKLARKDFHALDEGKDLFPQHLTTYQIHEGIKSGTLLQGTFHASRENFLEGFVNVDGHEESILLQGRAALNRAVDGDLVAVKLFSKDQWSAPSEVVLEDEEQGTDDLVVDTVQLKTNQKPTGQVVGIIRRNWRQYCGILQQSANENSICQLFVPAEKKIPKIRIETRQAESLRTQKIIVAIDSWPRHSRYPHGHFVRALGKIGERTTENEVLLLEHDVPHSHFSDQVLSCLPKIPWCITDEDVKVRTDLRHMDICSVDPPGCTDIDDALHCRQLSNGNLEVGVHIADVSHFIRPATALDDEAAARATTVYLVDMRIDMVPELLSSNLCSLRGGEDRFAFSCVWEMTKDAYIVSVEFHKSIIKSRRAMTYEEAQLKIDDKSSNDALAVSLRNLNKLAKILKRRRIDNGALVLASPEIRFQVDSETMDPIDVQAKKLFETNSMVEEFMLLANISVAEKILAEFPDCAMLRRHPQPPMSNFDPLVKAGRHLGFHIMCGNGKELATSLDETVRQDNPYLNTMFRILATRCMMQAVYFSSGMCQREEYQHYGLAVPLYTHFTSPIRRYADIVVHRLLAVCIGADVTYPQLLDKRRTHNLCHNLNYRNRMAQYAGRASVALNTHMFFRGKIQDEEAYILYVRKNALQILIPKYGLECTLYLGHKHSSVEFSYSEENQTQQCGDVVFHAFDPVTVRLSLDSNNIQHEKLVLQLVHPHIEGFSVESVSPASKRRESESDKSKKNRKRHKKSNK
ncbi:Dis3 [Carabus blaptoides fortunei]